MFFFSCPAGYRLVPASGHPPLDERENGLHLNFGVDSFRMAGFWCPKMSRLISFMLLASLSLYGVLFFPALSKMRCVSLSSKSS